MIYSVWNQGRRAYDYFEDDRLEKSANVPPPAHLTNRALGSTVEQASWPLPAGARPIGSGLHAVGRVAIAGGRAALGDLAEPGLVKAGLLLLAGALLIKFAVPRKRRRS